MPTTDALKIPVRPCEPWCDIPRGHADEHPVDRLCWSVFHRVPLTLHKAVDYGGDGWGHDKLEVLMRRQPNAEAPQVVLHREAGCEGCERDHETVLTLDEALVLRDKLDELQALANSGQAS